MIADDGKTPILMDLGSLAPSPTPITSRSLALQVQDTAAEHSTMPYRAPELFDVKTGSVVDTKVDIWSVGCTVIELLEGKPPYHFLDPMPALFRIVQDDCPPIPEVASPIVKDFLYHCFQKDCNLRISAKKLLRHPWMASARKQLASQHAESGHEGPRRPLSNYNYDEAVLKVQEWNEALRCTYVCRSMLYYSTNVTHSPVKAVQDGATTQHGYKWKAFT